MRTSVIIAILIFAFGTYGQSMKVHIKGSSAPTSYSLSTIDSITFEIGTPVDTAGLIAYYPFSDSAKDASGNGNNGSVISAVSTIDRFANPAQALYFDTLAYVQVPNSTSFSSISTELTLSTWVYFDSTRGFINASSREYNSHVICKGALPSVLTADFSLYFTRGATSAFGYPAFEVTNSTPTNALANSTDSIGTGKWYHIAVTFNAGSVSFYINGKFSNTVTVAPTSVRSSTQPLYIAHRYASSHHGRIKGKVDDVRIYNRALPQSEIGILYSEGGWAGN
jgi:hypothetical protein